MEAVSVDPFPKCSGTLFFEWTIVMLTYFCIIMRMDIFLPTGFRELVSILNAKNANHKHLIFPSTLY
jgi:hypothetical protein